MSESSVESDIEFVDLPPIARVGSQRKPNPVVTNFLAKLKENPGKWAKWPIERKTKPEVPEGYEVAARNGVNYASFVGPKAGTTEG